MSKQKNTSNSPEEKRSKSLINLKHTLKLALQSKQQTCLRTGKRIKTVEQLMQNIKSRRVQSYQKISFNIRKMDQIFKATLKKTTKHSPSPNPQKKSELQLSKQKQKTCMDFNPQPYKLKKNIIRDNHLIQDINVHIRAKTEHIEQNHQDSFFKQASFKKSNIFPTTTSILKSSRHEQPELNPIPGVSFKHSQWPQQGQEYSQDLTKTMSSIFPKNGSTTTYLHLNQLLVYDRDQRIESMVQIRKESQLESPPKQWQFYNCLKLNRLSLYKTNLRVSCENWVLIDYLQLKYLRGSDPKEQKQIKVATILLISNLLLQLQAIGLDCNKLRFRINNDLVVSKLEKQQRKAKDFSLEQNTIISVWDLFIGLIYTSKTDIVWHLIYLLAYLHQKYNFYVEGACETIEEYSSFLHIDTTAKLKEYQKIFSLLCGQLIKRLNLSSFTLSYKHKKYIGVMKNKLLRGEHYDSSLLKEENEVEYLLVKGNCIETAILFMECMSYPSFHDLFTNPAPVVPVKMQFWQGRRHEWMHRCAASKAKESFVLLDSNSENKNISSICFNKRDNAILVCNDSKANMTSLDCEAVLQWMRKTFKRFQSP